jgi:hypothetical protein
LNGLHAMPQGTTRTPRALLLAALTIAVAIVITPAAALASGPGVTIIGRGLDQPYTLSGDQIAAGGDVPSTSYTKRSRIGVATRVQLSGMSVRSALLRAGINVNAIRRISVSRADGGDLVLSRADLSSPGPFKEGPAVISDSGAATRIFRPVRNERDINARDDVTSFNSVPLLIRVDDATSIPVTATADPTQTRTGRDIKFSAKVASGGPGGYQYHWDFGDGATDEGQTVTHSFDTALDHQVQVTVTGNCANFCQGLDAVTVRVGTPQNGPNAPGATTPGSGTGNPLAPGTGTGTGAGGPGGSGGGDVAGATGEASVQQVLRELERQRQAERAQKRARALAAKRARQRREEADREARRVSPAEVTRPSGLTVTGILLAGQGAVLTGGLPPLKSNEPAGAPKGTQAARGTSIADAPSIPGGVAVALMVMAAGALRERRLVKLRTA